MFADFSLVYLASVEAGSRVIVALLVLWRRMRKVQRVGARNRYFRNRLPERKSGSCPDLLCRALATLCLPRWTSLIASAASLATALSISQFVASNVPFQQAVDFIRTLVIIGFAAVAAGIFSYLTIRLIDHLAGQRLSEILMGDQPISWRWSYLAALGVILGAAVALFTRLGIALL